MIRWMKFIAMVRCGQVKVPSDLQKFAQASFMEVYDFSSEPAANPPSPGDSTGLTSLGKSNVKSTSSEPRHNTGSEPTLQHEAIIQKIVFPEVPPTGHAIIGVPPVKSYNNSFAKLPDTDPRKGEWKSLGQRNMRMQTFVGWVNHHIKNSEAMPIDDVLKIGDGETIVHLVRCLTGEPLEDVVLPVESITSLQVKLQNIGAALKCFSSKYQVTLTSTASALTCNNVKAAMDVIWEFIYFHSIKPLYYAGLRDRFALFLWVQEHIAHADIQIQDFTSRVFKTLSPLPSTHWFTLIMRSQ